VGSPRGRLYGQEQARGLPYDLIALNMCQLNVSYHTYHDLVINDTYAPKGRERHYPQLSA
jgi:hypothetical protein